MNNPTEKQLQYIEQLVDAIRALEACVDIEPQDYLTDGESGSHHPLIEAVITEACGSLIHDSGQANYYMMNLLKQRGIRVVSGESDSFGWLTGVVITSKGRVVYG